MSAETRWTIRELLRWTTQYFSEQGVATPRLDAECLLAAALGSERIQLYLDFEKPIESAERQRFREWVLQRARQRVPVAQILGRKEFWSLSLQVTRDVLVPRPETEGLVELALRELPDAEAEYRVLDLGTGSGAIALAVASARPKAQITAVDVSEAALAVARRNAEELGVASRLRFLLGDWFEPLRSERFQLVLSNPPYLAEAEFAELAPELGHEPRLALSGGADGLVAYRQIIQDAPDHLEARGVLAMEMAPEQADVLCALCAAAGLGETAVQRDLRGQLRFVAARRAEEV